MLSMKFNARAPKALSECVCLGSLLVCLGISLTGSAAFAAGAVTGTISMSWGTVGAEQNLGVRAIAVNRRGGASGASGAPLGTPSQSAVTIYGNKGGGLVSLSAATYSATQEAGSVTITVNRTVGGSGGASVRYATANGTAAAGANYSAVQGSLSWGNNDTAPKSFVIPISTATSFTGSKTVAVP